MTVELSLKTSEQKDNLCLMATSVLLLGIPVLSCMFLILYLDPV